MLESAGPPKDATMEAALVCSSATEMFRGLVMLAARMMWL